MFDSTIGPESREGTIRVEREADGITAIRLEGDCDLTNASVLGDEIDRALESGTALILDLSDATFIDSSVIHALLGAARKANGRGQPAVVLQLGTAASVERVLEIVSIEQVLPRAHDRPEAIRIIQQSRTRGQREDERREAAGSR
jgi:anti-sigma B factor antagonist